MLRYFLQMVLCYPVTMLLVLPVSALLPPLGLSGEHPSHIHFAGYQALLCLLLGPIVGWAAARVVPSLAPTGRWTWVVPAIVLTVSIARALQVRPVPWLPEEFFATGGNEGLGVSLVTLPACSALGYSIGMILAGNPYARRARSGMSFATRGFLVVITLTALFVSGATMLRRFARAKMENWTKVRSIIDPAGLRFSQQPDRLCAGPASEELPLLKRALVERIESRVCGGGRLLEAGDPHPPDSFSVERVKVLDGPSAGTQGWVPSYGLQ